MNNNTITNTLPIMTDSTGNRLIKFNLDKSNALYYYDSDLPFEFIDNYLSLDRKKVIEDLENIIINSCIINKERVANSFAPLHALFLLGELEAEESLPVILHMLSQSEEYIDNIVGDFITEAVWMVIMKVGINQLDVLEKYAMEEDAHIFSRLAVCDAFVQIALHHPEKKDAILQIYDRIIKSISSASDHYEKSDPSFNAFIICNMIDLGLANYLPVIEELYSNNLIDRTITGTLEDTKNDFKKGQSQKNSKMDLMNIKEIYKYYFSVFGSRSFDNFDNKAGLHSNPEYSYIRENKKVNRNDPCPCGSGKKFKKCCAGNGLYD